MLRLIMDPKRNLAVVFWRYCAATVSRGLSGIIGGTIMFVFGVWDLCFLILPIGVAAILPVIFYFRIQIEFVESHLELAALHDSYTDLYWSMTFYLTGIYVMAFFLSFMFSIVALFLRRFPQLRGWFGRATKRFEEV